MIVPSLHNVYSQSSERHILPITHDNSCCTCTIHDRKKEPTYHHQCIQQRCLSQPDSTNNKTESRMLKTSHKEVIEIIKNQTNKEKIIWVGILSKETVTAKIYQFWTCGTVRSERCHHTHSPVKHQGSCRI